MIKSLINRWRIAAMVSVCAVVLAFAAWTSHTSSRQNNDVQVDNKTASIEIVSVEKDENGFLLRLRNSSTKEINGYTLLLSDGATITTDYTISGRVIASGEIAEAHVPRNDSLASESITIQSVVFADNSSEGSSNAIANIKNRRRGIKMQLKRILPLLKDMKSTQDADLTAALNRLKPQIQALPEQAENGLPPAVSEGLHDAKQDALRLIQSLERKRASNLSDFRKELSKELAEQEKRDARL